MKIARPQPYYLQNEVSRKKLTNFTQLSITANNFQT